MQTQTQIFLFNWPSSKLLPQKENMKITTLPQFCNVSACLLVLVSVCHMHISKTTRPIFSLKFSVYVIYGLVLLWQQCNMLCTTGFVDDIMFSHNGVNGPESKTIHVLSSSPGGGTVGYQTTLFRRVCQVMAPGESLPSLNTSCWSRFSQTGCSSNQKCQSIERNLLQTKYHPLVLSIHNPQTESLPRGRDTPVHLLYLLSEAVHLTF